VGIKIGLDFGTSNSGVAVSDGQNIRLLPIDPENVLPEVIKTILYVTREYQHYIGQEAIELYYKHNINRIRRYEMQWAGAIRVVASGSGCTETRAIAAIFENRTAQGGCFGRDRWHADVRALLSYR